MVAHIIDHPFNTGGVIPTPYNPDPALLAIVEIIRDGLVRDQHVRLHNFGTFRLRWTKTRQFKHPKTGELVTSTPIPKISFTPAKHLRDMIDPDRRPVIPLEETVDCGDMDGSHTRQLAKTTVSHHSPKPCATEQATLTEAIQDVVDENYQPPEAPTNIKQPDVNSNIKIKPSKTWALGLLAAVPFILTLLQMDFSADSETVVHSTNSPKENVMATQVDQETITDNIPLSAEQITTDINTDRPKPDGFTDTLSTAPSRTEPSTSTFYMRPLVHTIDTADNLWKLAERYYGDALLWPHIFRANMRTLNDPDTIIMGNKLIIPGLQQAPNNLSAKDRELIAQGYYEVYQTNRVKNNQHAIYFLLGAKQYSYEWLTTVKSSIPWREWSLIEKE